MSTYARRRRLAKARRMARKRGDVLRASTNLFWESKRVVVGQAMGLQTYTEDEVQTMITAFNRAAKGAGQ